MYFVFKNKADFVRDPERLTAAKYVFSRTERLRRTKTSANQQDERAFRTLMIFGGFRRKRLAAAQATIPYSLFPNFPVSFWNSSISFGS